MFRAALELGVLCERGEPLAAILLVEMVHTKAWLSALVTILEGAVATLDPIVVGRLEVNLQVMTSNRREERTN